MKKLLVNILAITLSATGSFAQNEESALRFSRTDFGGTARYNAMSGAFGALGGDFSVLSTNPAGIGIYRGSEFTVTPTVYHQISEATHYGNTVEDSKLNFNFNNIGYVASFNSGSYSGWVSSNFGIGYNRQANFHSRTTVEGVNHESSLLDVYLQQVNDDVGTNYASIEDKYPFGANLAWYSYLIDTVPGNPGEYQHAIPAYGESQSATITTRGSIGETVISYGGNYENRLYIGASLGMSSIRYSQAMIYEETPEESDTSTYINSFTFTENRTTSGRGFNFKLGMIYRLHDFLRIGGAIHTPTVYSNITDQLNTSMETEYADGSTYAIESPSGLMDYSLTTPFKAIGSAAIIFGKRGLLNVDYEYTDFSSMGLSSSAYSFNHENQQIRDKYQPTGNIRIGTEWRYHSFSFRGGFAHYGNPYTASTGSDGSYQTYSIGAGVREKSYFIDAAYTLTNRSEQLYMYNPDLIAASEVRKSTGKFMATVGIRF